MTIEKICSSALMWGKSSMQFTTYWSGDYHSPEEYSSGAILILVSVSNMTTGIPCRTLYSGIFTVSLVHFAFVYKLEQSVAK